MNPTVHKFIGILMGLILLTLFGACVPHETLLTLQKAEQGQFAQQIVENHQVLRFKKSDVITIEVFGQDPEAVAPFNLRPMDEGLASSGAGYLVDQDGTISFPVLGKVDAEGKSVEELRLSLENQLKTYLNEPIVAVRISNFKVTILGEIELPGTHLIENDRLTILDAIGLSGDLTDYANRRNIQVIREVDGKRIFGEVNLQDRSVFRSPYFYLQQNDIVVVEPIKEKTATVRTQSQNLVPWVAALTSLATLIVTLTR